jgi:hypothetical protein
VAMHCYRGSFLFEDANDGIDFLFHDASEGLGFCDVMAPMKRLPEMTFYREREDECMEAVAGKYRLRPRFWDRQVIKAVDRAMLYQEQQELLAPPPKGMEWGVWKSTEIPARWRWNPTVAAVTAKRLWLLRLAELGATAGREDLAALAHEVLAADERAELAALGHAP